jgi:hypothetical protein
MKHTLVSTQHAILRTIREFGGLVLLCIRALGRTLDEGFKQILTLAIVIFLMEPATLSVSIAVGILGYAAWVMLSKKLVRNLQINTYGYWIE